MEKTKTSKIFPYDMTIFHQNQKVKMVIRGKNSNGKHQKITFQMEHWWAKFFHSQWSKVLQEKKEEIDSIHKLYHK